MLLARAKNIIKNANAMAEEFKKHNVKVISNGTDNHLMLIDVKSSFGEYLSQT